MRYTENYVRQHRQRPDGTFEPNWLNATVGEIKPIGTCPGRENVVGYDVPEFIRARLKSYGGEYTGMSVCELILQHDRFADLRQFVRPAEVFWSHIQLEGFLAVDKKETTVGYIIRHDETRKKCAYWLDYFSLRQNGNDFDPEIIMALIARVGSFVATVPPDFSYLTRCFCILEIFSAVRAQKADPGADRDAVARVPENASGQDFRIDVMQNRFRPGADGVFKMQKYLSSHRVDAWGEHWCPSCTKARVICGTRID
jgi:hypothetical protein